MEQPNPNNPKKDIDFAQFKRLSLDGIEFVNRGPWNNDEWNHHYSQFITDMVSEDDDEPTMWNGQMYSERVAEYMREQHIFNTYESNDVVPIRKCGGWYDANYTKPPENIPVLVNIPSEDDHVTSGMWDVSGDWVLLDENRKVDSSDVKWWSWLQMTPRQMTDPDFNPPFQNNRLLQFLVRIRPGQKFFSEHELTQFRKRMVEAGNLFDKHGVSPMMLWNRYKKAVTTLESVRDRVMLAPDKSRLIVSSSSVKKSIDTFNQTKK